MKAGSPRLSNWSFASSLFVLAVAFAAKTGAQQKKAPALNGPDDRYKADILVVVAHPDDESGCIAGYMARVLYDRHKRVAAVFINRGQHGNNEAGPEEGN